jgi:hypothetical protein
MVYGYDVFEILVGVGILWVVWLLLWMFDYNDKVINRGRADD